MSTDIEWEKWGRQDPYYGVITDPRFRSERLTEHDRSHFFETGRIHVHYVIQVVRQRLDPLFAPGSMLDFGCGVGRVLLPAARLVKRAVGVDVSPSMLAEARRNCGRDQLNNVELVQQGGVDGLPKASFDLVHSAIVLQHIDVARGTRLFGDLVALVAPNGVGAIQVTYSKSLYADSLGVEPAPLPAPEPAPKGLLRVLRKGAAQPLPDADPAMQMNPYPLTPLFFQLQDAGIHNIHVEFTNHGGELGLFLFFQRTGQPGQVLQGLAPSLTAPSPVATGSDALRPTPGKATTAAPSLLSPPTHDSIRKTTGQVLTEEPRMPSNLYAALLEDAAIESPSQLSTQQKIWFDYAASTNRRGDELLRTLIANFTGSLVGRRVLDIGCGFGGTAIAAGKAGATVLGVDLSEKNLRVARQNLRDFGGLPVEFQAVDVTDAEALEKLGRFDLVIADNVIKHVASPAKLFAAASVLMKSGAHLYITAPNARSVEMVRSECHYSLLGASLFIFQPFCSSMETLVVSAISIRVVFSRLGKLVTNSGADCAVAFVILNVETLPVFISMVRMA